MESSEQNREQAKARADSDESLLEAAISSESANRVDGVVIGTVRAVSGASVQVDHPASPSRSPLAAVSTIAITEADVDRSVALAFQDNDPRRPVILGFLWNGESASRSALEVSADQERVELKADREIVLRCGKASITLTQDGKILLRGAYLLSRASGVNRVKGGSVQIN